MAERGTWTTYKMVGFTWTLDGSLYHPNDTLALPKIATQNRIILADGSKAYVTPSTVFLNEPLTFVWYLDDGTTKTKLEAYVTNGNDIKIIDHNDVEYKGRFTSVESSLRVGMTDTYDIHAIFERMADVGSSSSSVSSSSSCSSSSSSSSSMSSSSSSSSSRSSSCSSSSSFSATMTILKTDLWDMEGISSSSSSSSSLGA